MDQLPGAMYWENQATAEDVEAAVASSEKAFRIGAKTGAEQGRVL